MLIKGLPAVYELIVHVFLQVLSLPDGLLYFANFTQKHLISEIVCENVFQYTRDT